MPRNLRTSLLGRYNPEGRQHLIPGLTPSQFIERMNKDGISYVLLGGNPDTGENVEFLVSDADLKKIGSLFTPWPVGVPVSIYSPTARPRTAYYPPYVERSPSNRIALFVPHIANELLAAARPDGPRGAKLLPPEQAFYAAAYRVTYAGAVCCDWRDSTARCAECRSWDERLKALAAEAGIALPKAVTPELLDEMLERRGWRPAHDLLEKSARWAPWIKDAFDDLEFGASPEPPGLCVFFIRERVIEDGLKSEAIETLQEKGFDPILMLDLDEEQREKMSRVFRGGNWGPHGKGLSGGRPACIMVGLDLLPLPVEGRLARRYPSCDNLKILRAKKAIREFINARLPKSQQYNALHSTDNTGQAWRAIRLLAPEREAELRELIGKSRVETPIPDLVKDLTRYGSRAKVALVQHEGNLAIRKSFRPNKLHYMEREIEVMQELGPICPEVPKLLFRGPDHIIVEYVGESEAIPAYPHPLPLREVRQLAHFIKTCVSHGFDPIDMKPRGNVLLTKNGLKVIDFEFWRRCDPATLPEKSYCLAGLPSDYSGNRPRGVLFLYDPYPTQWFRHTALSVQSFLYDPAWLQAIKRAAHLARRYAGWVPGVAARQAVRPLKGLRRTNASQSPVFEA